LYIIYDSAKKAKYLIKSYLQ